MARVLITSPAPGSKPALDVALSERNVLILLTKLFTPGSACSFISGDVPDEYVHATIRIEPDEYHYASPTREGAPPGPMHPVSERFAAAVKVTLEQWAAETRASIQPRTAGEPSGPHTGGGR